MLRNWQQQHYYFFCKDIIKIGLCNQKMIINLKKSYYT